MPADLPTTASDWVAMAGADGLTASIGSGYRLWALNAPNGGAEALPVLVVLDAAILFPVIAPVVRWLSRRADATGVGPFVLAGIDCEDGDRDRRYRDLTFGPPADPAGQVGQVPWGGGEAFADILHGPVLDAVEAVLPIDRNRVGLLGHSLAGQFAVQGMARTPHTYRAVAAISPSLWWDYPSVERTTAALEDVGQGIFLGVGSLEQPARATTEAEERRKARRMVSNVRDLAGVLARRLPADRLSSRIAEAEDHASALVSLLPSALRFVSAQLNRDHIAA